MDEFQKQASVTAVYQETLKDYLGRLSYCVHGLTGEAGEIANKMKKVYRGDIPDHEFRRLAIDEMGDVLWYIAMLAMELGVTLDDVARQNLQKLSDRKARGVIKGSGDHR
jgi:NTP pyrophosphatase (non-canonical NTP hydrolase)